MTFNLTKRNLRVIKPSKHHAGFLVTLTLELLYNHHFLYKIEYTIYSRVESEEVQKVNQLRSRAPYILDSLEPHFSIAPRNLLVFGSPPEL